MQKRMLINTVEGVECRIAIISDGRLEELYIERASSASRVGNIYKGRVTNVEPAIQAAFVDFGMTKNGFLHVSDLHPQYFPRGKAGTEPVGRKYRHRDRPPIQECLHRGQEVLVQMTKEGIGTKGPTLTTYLSIPGRYLVMMPGMSRLGVSRKIEDEQARDKARELLVGLSLPPEMGFIVRTAGLNRSKRDLSRDLNYLLRLWKSVKDRIKTAKPPAEIYQESDLVIRTVRDVYNTDIDRIICDKRSDALKVKEFLDVAMPRGKHLIELYVGKEGLFHDYGLEEEIEKIYSRRVELPCGGSLVIDQTEALVAVDVNSGRFRDHSNAETTALRINTEAAAEVARQLRLRDLGGVIIIDFIDMRDDSHCRAVDRAMREAMKYDRAKTKIQRISPFGIVEMTRQRMRPSLKDSIYALCPSCNGTGHLKSEESLSLEIMRLLQRICHVEAVAHVRLAVSRTVAHHLSNYRRQQLGQMEADSGKTVVVEANADLRGDEIHVTCTNNRGSEVAWQQPPPAKTGPRQIATVGVSTPAPPAPPQAPAAGPQPPRKPAAPPAAPEQAPAAPQQAAQAPAGGQQPGKGRRRRGRRGRRKSKGAQQPQAGPSPQGGQGQPLQAAQAPAPQGPSAPPLQPGSPQAGQTPAAQPGENRKRRRSRRRRRSKGAPAGQPQAPAQTSPQPPTP
ncbi:MAG: Rne/Rng family ribonuclease [Phycisphaerae bacterium]|nr:Rne/Rng family ribonuclease [Phycisphaerae bacterium]